MCLCFYCVISHRSPFGYESHPDSTACTTQNVAFARFITEPCWYSVNLLLFRGKRKACIQKCRHIASVQIELLDPVLP